MNLRALICLVGLAALEGCSVGTGSHAESPVTTLASNLRQIAPAGTVRSSMATARIVLAPSAQRGTQGIYGGSPTFAQSVDLYDAPIAGFSQVNIAITEIDAVSSTGTVVPMQTFSTPEIVNLLSLQTTPLAIGGTIPTGSYAGLQLIGNAAQSSAVTNAGTSMPVTVEGASGSTFTLTVGVAFGTAASGTSSDVSLDFNLAESMLVDATTSSGQRELVLKPLLVAKPAAGVLHGIAVNGAGSGVANAIVALVDASGKVVNTTISAADGSFNVHAVPYGTYQVEIYNAYENAAGSTFAAVNADGASGSQYYGPTVTISAPTTNLGTVQD